MLKVKMRWGELFENELLKYIYFLTFKSFQFPLKSHYTSDYDYSKLKVLQYIQPALTRTFSSKSINCSNLSVQK